MTQDVSSQDAIAVMLQVLAGQTQIDGNPEALAHLCDSLYRRVLSAELSEMDGPFTTDDSGMLTEVIEALSWAESEIACLNAISREESAAVEEGAA